MRVCDRCGDTGDLLQLDNHRLDPQSIDLCRGCWEAFREYVRPVPTEAPSEKPTRRGRPRKHG